MVWCRRDAEHVKNKQIKSYIIKRTTIKSILKLMKRQLFESSFKKKKTLRREEHNLQCLFKKMCNSFSYLFKKLRSEPFNNSNKITPTLDNNNNNNISFLFSLNCQLADIFFCLIQ